MSSDEPHGRSDGLPSTTTQDSKPSRSGGFRSFWKQDKDKTPAVSPGEATSSSGSIIPFGKRKDKSSRIGLFIKKGTATASAAQSEGNEGTASQKRRQQVYQAQKRHRNRRAEYIKNLEDEVAKLRSLDSSVRHEKSTLEGRNRVMKELLASHSIDAQLGSMSLAAPAPTSGRDVEMLDFATVDVRFDTELKRERTFLDHRSASEEMAWSSEMIPKPPVGHQKAPGEGDSWAAVDFILALEWPCRGHVAPPGINPDVTRHIEPQFTGHSLTTTAAVHESALPLPPHLHKQINGTPGRNGGNDKADDKWLLPHSEIEKLVKLSENLPLDDEQMTPAQAYSAIRQNLTCDGDLRAILELLKIPLGAMAECQGYGAVLPADQFWQHLETAITCLKA